MTWISAALRETVERARRLDHDSAALLADGDVTDADLEAFRAELAEIRRRAAIVDGALAALLLRRAP